MTTDERVASTADTFAAYWDAVLANDASSALAVVDRALADGADVRVVLDGVVAASQHRVGQLWAEGHWTVAQEHAATAVSEYVVRGLLGRLARDPSVRRRTSPALVVACAEREWHALPGLLLAAALGHAGHRVVHLGSDVTTRVLQSTLLDTTVRAVLVSASLTSSLPFVRLLLETASEAGVPTVVGGQAFDPDGLRAAALGATAFAATAADVDEVLRGLPPTVSPVPPLLSAGLAEARMIGVRVTALSRAVTHEVVTADLGPTVEQLLTDQVPVVVGSVVSALLVDDPGLVADSAGWLREVLVARGAEPALVDRVLAALGHELRDFPLALATLPDRDRA